MDVSIIIVNYNTSQLTRQAISSIIETTNEISYEVIVVDNNSTEKESFATNIEVKEIFLKKNIGFGRANNEGLKIATGRNILFLNPDTIIVNDAIKKLSNYLDQHKNVAICGGNLFSKELQPAHSYSFLYPSILKDLDFIFFRAYTKCRYGKNADFNYTKSPLSVAYICGADMMIKKEILDECGSFDPTFFLYNEETDLAYRIHSAGYDIHAIPDAQIIHLDGQSFKFSEERESFVFEGKKNYYNKHFSSSYIYLSQLMNRFFLRLSILLFHFIGNEQKTKKYKYRLSLYKQDKRS